MSAVYVVSLVLAPTIFIPNIQAAQLCPGLYNDLQKAVTLNTYCVFHMLPALIRHMQFLKRSINELGCMIVECDTRTLKCMCWSFEKFGTCFIVQKFDYSNE